MKRLFLAVCVLVGCALAGCNNKETSKTTTNTNAATTTNTKGSQPTAPAAETGEDYDTTTGITECDALLTKMHECIQSNNASEALKDGYRRSFKKTRDGYRKLAAGSPQ